MVYVYDIESYPNIFTFTFRPVKKSREIIVFEISDRKDDRKELLEFLKQKDLTLVGFNNYYFDYPILHHLLENPRISIEMLYRFIQEKIMTSKHALVPEWKIKIPQIDLYKINHYDNANRMTSLKWLEFMLRWPKVQDLPFPVGRDVPYHLFDELIEYNINDVDFTYHFLGKCMDAILFRQDMSKILNKNVMNYSDVKIGEYLNQITYSRLSGRQFSEFKELRTHRGRIHIKDIIPDYVEFKTPYMQEFLEDIKKDSFFIDDDDWHRIIEIDGFEMKVAKGGLHSKDTPRIIQCEEGFTMKEKDVGSMYPASMINGKMYPEHLGEAWYEGIKLLYEERSYKLKPEMKKHDKNSPEYKALDSKQAAYKLAMNGGGYGKTGSQWSWQYDPLIMVKVTFKGQLSLLMLIEEYSMLGYVELISANTDGLVIKYPSDKEGEVQRIHEEWEKITGYMLEDTYYNRIIFRDVNNYIAEIIDPKTKERVKMKYKGCFEIDPEYHKNGSNRIVPIAMMEYFINDIPVKETVQNIGREFINSKGEKERTTIFDYCEGRKSNDKVDNYSLVSGNDVTEIKDKVIRFYISNSRDKLVKVYSSGKIENINKGFNHTLFMEYEEREDYDINYDFYINECRKIIDPIEIGTRKLGYKEPEQLKMF